MKFRLAIVTTHPIQYYAPIFKLLEERGNIGIKVFYTFSQAKEGVTDKTFQRKIKWDIPLLEGYEYTFVENVAKNPDTQSWNGVECPSLIPMIEKWNPNAVLVFGWHLKSHLKVIRYFKGKIPVWFRGDSTLLDEHKNLKRLLRRLWLTFVYRQIDGAFYVGKENKKYFLAHGVTEEQLVLAPHAIDNSRFHSDHKRNYDMEASQWRNQLGFSKDDFVVVFSGKFEHKKDPEILINAVTAINAVNDVKIRLLLIGNGPLEEKLAKLTQENEHILTLPFQNQSKMPVVYRLGEVYCLPSQGPGETWGLAVNEAMASGRPVVVSDKVGCARDLVQSGYNGEIFSAGNQGHLEEMLLKVQKSNYSTLGENAKQYIQSWSFLKICEAIENSLLSTKK